MADPRTHVPVLEQPRLRIALALIGAAILVVGGVAIAARGGNPDAPARVEAGLAYPVPPREGRILVEVLNASGRNGLARAATRVLRQEGIDVISTGNADVSTAPTRIVVRRGDASRGRIVARALGAGAVTQSPDTLRRVDVSVYLGPDYHPVLPLHP